MRVRSSDMCLSLGQKSSDVKPEGRLLKISPGDCSNLMWREQVVERSPLSATLINHRKYHTFPCWECAFVTTAGSICDQRNIDNADFDFFLLDPEAFYAPVQFWYTKVFVLMERQCIPRWRHGDQCLLTPLHLSNLCKLWRIRKHTHFSMVSVSSLLFPALFSKMYP